MTSKRREKHNPEQIFAKLLEADAMLNVDKELASVPQALEISEATLHRWRTQYGEMKSEEAKRLKALEDENPRLKEIVADLTLDIKMLNHLSEENWRALPESGTKVPATKSGGGRRSAGSRHRHGLVTGLAAVTY